MATLVTDGGLSVRVVFAVPFIVAVIVTAVALPTAVVVSVKFADAAPASTVTLAGVVAAELLSDKVTTIPPVGAGPVKVTVPVEDVPPVTLAGFIDTVEIAGALTVSAAVLLTPLNEAVIVAVVVAATAVVFTVKFAVEAPAATVTLAGTVAEPLLLERVTTVPPAGANPVRVTVPVDDVPPVTLVGFSATLESAAGLIVRVAVCVPPVIVAVVIDATAVVFTVKFPAVAPAATVTLAGTVAAPLLLDRDTTMPPEGAGPFNVTVPVELLPPTTLVGFTATEDTVGGLIVSDAL